MSKVIGVDIDGCLADFNRSYIDLVIEVAGEDKFPPRPFDIPTWNYPEHFGYSNEVVKEVWNRIKASPTFWYDLGPYGNTVGFLQNLSELEYDIYFVTNRMGWEPKLQTELWLSDNGYDMIPTVLVTEDKCGVANALRLTHYIDDKPSNCQSVYDGAPNTQGYVLHQPWNVGLCEGIPRLDNLQEFLEVIKE